MEDKKCYFGGISEGLILIWFIYLFFLYAITNSIIKMLYKTLPGGFLAQIGIAIIGGIFVVCISLKEVRGYFSGISKWLFFIFFLSISCLYINIIRIFYKINLPGNFWVEISGYIIGGIFVIYVSLEKIPKNEKFACCFLGIGLIFGALVLLTEKFLLETTITLLLKICGCIAYFFSTTSFGVEIYRKVRMEKMKIYTNEYIIR